MSEQEKPNGTVDETVAQTVEVYQQNFRLSDETALAAAEDQVHPGPPAPSSEAVELERIERAQRLERGDS